MYDDHDVYGYDCWYDDHGDDAYHGDDHYDDHGDDAYHGDDHYGDDHDVCDVYDVHRHDWVNNFDYC
jgi:hypothetical protein